MEEPIRILQVFGKLNLGGAESRMMDLYRHMDRSRVQFDFLVHSSQEGYFEQEIKELGGRIFRVPRFRFYNYFSYRAACKKFFVEHHEFQMVQGHITSTAAIYLPIAKKAGIGTTIAHVRSAGVDPGLKGMLTRFLRRNLSKRADLLFTCSRLAAVSAYGQKAVEEGKPIFIPNAIDCRKFEYNRKLREQVRTELGIQKQYVIGHVGRFHYAKNHEYLIRIFSELVKLREDYVLLLLGDGPLLEETKKLAKELGVAEKILFAGSQGDVFRYYQAMDYFVYPSRYEGLPGTVIEAQTAGLLCLMSDTIAEEVIVTELVETMSITEAPVKWAERINAKVCERELQKEENGKEIADDQAMGRRGHLKEVSEAGFDVNTQAEKMLLFYETGDRNILKNKGTQK